MDPRLFQHPHLPKEVIRSHPAYKLLMELKECRAKDRKDGHLPLWRTEPTDADRELENFFIRIYNDESTDKKYISAERYDVMVTYFLGWYESSEDQLLRTRTPWATCRRASTECCIAESRCCCGNNGWKTGVVCP